MHDDLKTLTERFRSLGASDPESWARSQFEDGIPQLARFVFLRQAWRNIVDESDATWIGAAIADAAAQPTAPYAGAGHALARLRALGASDSDLTDLVRAKQAEILFTLCYQLDDSGVVESEAPDIGWALVQIDEEGNVLHAIQSLHESVLETDPTGREMRPR